MPMPSVQLNSSYQPDMMLARTGVGIPSSLWLRYKVLLTTASGLHRMRASLPPRAEPFLLLLSLSPVWLMRPPPYGAAAHLGRRAYLLADTRSHNREVARFARFR